MLPVVVAALLDLVPVRADLFGDEIGHTFQVVCEGDFWRNITDPSMCHPPLYFVLAKVAYSLFGVPWAVRLPSVLFAIGTVILSGLMARRLLGDQYFLPALWLAAISPFVIEFAPEGRAYSAMIFFSVATAWAFWEFLENETSGRMLALAACGVLGGLTHYFFWLDLVFLGVYYLARRRRLTGLAAAAGGLVAAGLLPWALLASRVQSGEFSRFLQVNWVRDYLQPVNFLGRLVVAIFFGYGTFSLPRLDPARNVPLAVLGANAIPALLAGVFFVGLAVGWLLLAREGAPLLWFLTLGAVVPAALGLAASMAGLYLIREKHLAATWIFFFLLTLLVAGRLVRTRTGLVVMACYVFLAILSDVHTLAFPHEFSRRMDWSGLSDAIVKTAKPGDVIVSYAYPWEEATRALDPATRTKLPFEILARGSASAASLADEASRLDGKAPGTIYVIDDETQRFLVDPADTVARRLASDRRATTQHFGRNLSLRVFAVSR
jgi:hypothetical protein